MALRAAFKHLVLAAAGLLCAGASAEPSFVPVFNQDFPDAFVLPHGSEFIAYATNNGPNVPIATSRDLVHWSFAADPASGKRRDALPQLGSWAKTGFTWAPEVLQLGNRYLLYYTASDRRKNMQCIGVAEAIDPLGPFVDSRSEPIVCQTALGGSIDADPFRDADGKLYLYFKNDGNRVGNIPRSGASRSRRMDCRSTGPAVELIHDDKKLGAKAGRGADHGPFAGRL